MTRRRVLSTQMADQKGNSLKTTFMKVRETEAFHLAL